MRIVGGKLKVFVDASVVITFFLWNLVILDIELFIKFVGFGIVGLVVLLCCGINCVGLYMLKFLVLFIVRVIVFTMATSREFS